MQYPEKTVIKDNIFHVCVIGLGEIGGGIFMELSNKFGSDQVFGVDISDTVIKRVTLQGLNAGKEIPKAHNYIVAVYTAKQIIDVCKKIPLETRPLISIEATSEPDEIQKINKAISGFGNYDLVYFPHRFNPDDPEHQYFNLHRVIAGVTDQAAKRAIAFYSQFMPKELIHQFPLEVVSLTKAMENSYRFIEIAIAEDIKMACDKRGIDFKLLRESMNTKWNINVLEARDGIYKKCLPKDSAIIRRYFPDLKILTAAIETDTEYKKYAKGVLRVNPWYIISPLIIFSIFVIFMISNRVLSHYYVDPVYQRVEDLHSNIQQINKESSSGGEREERLNREVTNYIEEVRELKEAKNNKIIFPGTMLGGMN